MLEDIRNAFKLSLSFSKYVLKPDKRKCNIYMIEINKNIILLVIIYPPIFKVTAFVDREKLST